MNMVRHEDVGQDGEIVEFCGFIYPYCQEFADLVVLEIWLSMKGRECELMGVTRNVPCFSGLVLGRSCTHELSFTCLVVTQVTLSFP